ncbi:hypothetical protein BON30_06365 [Cystobacter ferrugineus]|uniref:Uncharacterized protein n=1 Tax=Cystobacter ferrugineus TaxID=83449 RepID=A0A1L9BKF0_9BACT|nr:hypothetical protein BON30_06365 [Cystobacter ferrugineus]
MSRGRAGAEGPRRAADRGRPSSEPGGWRGRAAPFEVHACPGRFLDIYRLTEGQWVLAHSLAGEERVRAESFEAIEFELPLLWSE